MNKRRDISMTVLALFVAAVVIVCVLVASWETENSKSAGPAHSAPRSPEWPKVEKSWLQDHGECAVCKATSGLQVHHLIPFHDRPELELDTNNLVTLCGPKGRNCHLYWGHLGDYRCYNHDLPKWLKAIRERKEE